MADSRLPLVDSHPVAAFFVGAYLWTWLISAPALFMEPSWSAAGIIYVGSFGAPVSAAVVTYVRGDDVRAWARQIWSWRVGWTWWLAALGTPIAAAVLITLGIYLLRGPVDLTQELVSPALFVGIFLFTMVLSGGLNEEPGWRGFAQARLNERYGALQASLVIGVVWAVWHLPYFFAPVTPHSSFPLVNQIGWFGGILTLSVILAWVYNSTGSVLMAMVLHSMANTADTIIPFAADQLIIDGAIDQQAVALVTGVHIGVYVLIVIALVAYYGTKTLAAGDVPTARDVGSR